MRRIRAIIKSTQRIKVETDVLQHRAFTSLQSIVRFTDKVTAAPCVQRLSTLLNGTKFGSIAIAFSKRFSSILSATRYQSSLSAFAYRHAEGSAPTRAQDRASGARGRTSILGNSVMAKTNASILRKAASTIASNVHSLCSVVGIAMRCSAATASSKAEIDMNGYAKRFTQTFYEAKMQTVIDSITCMRRASALAQAKHSTTAEANIARYALFSDYDELSLSGLDDKTLQELTYILA